MRKLVLILIALIAVVTFIRAFDQSEELSEQAMVPAFEIETIGLE
jgi:hypothetical protein